MAVFPKKLYLTKQVVGGCWPMGYRLLTPDLGYWCVGQDTLGCKQKNPNAYWLTLNIV